MLKCRPCESTLAGFYSRPTHPTIPVLSKLLNEQTRTCTTVAFPGTPHPKFVDESVSAGLINESVEVRGVMHQCVVKVEPIDVHVLEGEFAVGEDGVYVDFSSRIVLCRYGEGGVE